MSERELTSENVGELLGLPKREAPQLTEPEPDDHVDEQQIPAPEAPEPDVPEISDTNDNVNEDLRRAVEQSEQRDAALLAAGIPPARTIAQKREADRAFAELIHPPRTEDE